MPVIALIPLLLGQAVPAPEARIRYLNVSVTDEKGDPITGLTADEVAVVENGVARELTRVELDRRPLTLAVLVDTSQAMDGRLRQHVIEPLAAFLAGLPEGSRYALWTTGDRPTRAVDYTSDTQQAAQALRRAFLQGGNTVLDAIVEAGQDLGKREGERNAVLVVTNYGTEFSNRDRLVVVEEALKHASLFLAVGFDEAGEGLEQRARYEYVLSELTRRSGGLFETPLSALGVGSALRKLSADLRGLYRIGYASLPEVKPRKVEVEVARAGAKVRAGQPQ